MVSSCIGVARWVVSIAASAAVLPAMAEAPATKGPPEVAPSSFEECVAQRGKVLKSYPARCVSAEGVTFVDQRAELGGEKSCKDLCGDGQCQEIVCMAIGCPCAESHASCPKDCHE